MTCCSVPAVVGNAAETQPDLDGMLHLPEVVHRRFQLSTNPAENQLLRSGFYYEQVCTAGRRFGLGSCR